MLDHLARQEVDILDCTPSQLAAMLSAGMLAGDRWTPHAALVGGEPIDQGMWHRLAQARKTRFYNVYGPTECTVDAAIAAIVGASETPNIGRPISNARIYLLDEHLEPVPMGVAGEIWWGGVCCGWRGRR